MLTRSPLKCYKPRSTGTSQVRVSVVATEQETRRADISLRERLNLCWCDTGKRR